MTKTIILSRNFPTQANKLLDLRDRATEIENFFFKKGQFSKF